MDNIMLLFYYLLFKLTRSQSLHYSNFNMPNADKFLSLRNCEMQYREKIFSMKCGRSAVIFDKRVFPIPSFLRREDILPNQPHFLENTVRQVALNERIAVVATFLHQLYFIDFKPLENIETYFLQYNDENRPYMVDTVSAQELVLVSVLLASNELQIFAYDPDSTDFFLENEKHTEISKAKLFNSSLNLSDFNQTETAENVKGLILMKDFYSSNYFVFLVYKSFSMKFSISVPSLEIQIIGITEFPCIPSFHKKVEDFILLVCESNNSKIEKQAKLFRNGFNDEICSLILSDLDDFSLDLIKNERNLLILQKFAKSTNFYSVSYMDSVFPGKCQKLNETLDLQLDSFLFSGQFGIIDFNEQTKYEQINLIFPFSRNGSIQFGRSVLCMGNLYYDARTDGCAICPFNTFSLDSLQNQNCESCSSTISEYRNFNEYTNCRFAASSKSDCNLFMKSLFPENEESWEFFNIPALNFPSVHSCQLDCSLNDSQACLLEKKRNFYCSSYSDCFNCSLDPFCDWNGSSCFKRKAVILGGYKWRTHLSCQNLPYCGFPQNSDNSLSGIVKFTESGNINFSSNYFCSWVINVPSISKFNDMQIELKNIPVHISSGKKAVISFCLIQDYGNCHLHRGILEKYGKIYVKSNTITFFLYLPYQGEYNTSNFEISYTKIDMLFFGTEIGEWIVRMGIIFLFIFCSSFICFSFLYKILFFLRINYNFRIPLLGNFVEEYEMETPEERLKRLIDTSRIETDSFSHNSTSEFNQTECSFCLESFEENEEIGKLLCKHIYHFRCIKDWNNYHQSKMACPICQAEI